MKASGAAVFRAMLICIALCSQLSLAEERVYRLNTQTVQTPFGGGSIPAINSVGNMQAVSPSVSTPPICLATMPSFNSSACAAYLANDNNSFIVYRKDEIDSKTQAIGSQLDELGRKVDSLNKRIVDDEAGLPAAVDQYAVQKLLDKINALEARVKTLESQAGSHQQ